ncbi:hypothetical protein [Thermogemmatispora tikiterensis]|uniref:PEGA domain-containing protein n=1 Tax=Thermogemmatispora tikiterensis TaxID=1825093 RepID=A0A328VFP2_9CHLR|nr:hypothetical protein [Thermogemmatispora tikiterensis]RAQ96638.1 hypothetical protein A4R35_13930 [Thermogemmatispora tikiterensis]
MDKPSNQSGQSPLEPVTAQETEKEEIAFVLLPGSGQTWLWPRAAALRSGSRLSGLAALLALFLTALLLCYLFPVGEIAQQLVRFFIPEQPASINSASYYLSVDVPWTQITVDGQPLQQKSILAFISPLQLLRGTHLISWQAAPFREQSCTISVPPSAGDSCPTSTTQYQGGRQIQVLWLRDRLSDLAGWSWWLQLPPQ